MPKGNKIRNHKGKRRVLKQHDIDALRGRMQEKTVRQIAKEQGVSPMAVCKRQKKATKIIFGLEDIDQIRKEMFSDTFALFHKSVRRNLKRGSEAVTNAYGKGFQIYQEKRHSKGELEHSGAVDVNARVNVQVDNLKKMIGLPTDQPLNLKVKSKRIVAKDDDGE